MHVCTRARARVCVNESCTSLTNTLFSSKARCVPHPHSRREHAGRELRNHAPTHIHTPRAIRRDHRRQHMRGLRAAVQHLVNHPRPSPILSAGPTRLKQRHSCAGNSDTDAMARGEPLAHPADTEREIYRITHRERWRGRIVEA